MNSTPYKKMTSFNGVDAGTRNIIRYALGIEDPLLADLVRRVDPGERIIDESGFLKLSRLNT